MAGNSVMPRSFLPRSVYTGPARHRRGRSPWHLPAIPLVAPAAEKHRARSAQRHQLMGVHRQIAPVQGGRHILGN